MTQHGMMRYYDVLPNAITSHGGLLYSRAFNTQFPCPRPRFRPPAKRTNLGLVGATMKLNQNSSRPWTSGASLGKSNQNTSHPGTTGVNVGKMKRLYKTKSELHRHMEEWANLDLVFAPGPKASKNRLGKSSSSTNSSSPPPGPIGPKIVFEYPLRQLIRLRPPAEKVRKSSSNIVFAS